MKTLKPLQMFLGLLVILTVFLFIFPSPVAAFDWFTANQATVAWDAVTAKTDGQPLDALDSMEYSIYLSDSLLPLKDSTVVAWRGPELQTTLTLLQEGAFFVGIKAHRIRDGDEVSQSIVVWSDEPLYTNDQPFGLRYWMAPAAVTGLHPS